MAGGFRSRCLLVLALCATPCVALPAGNHAPALLNPGARVAAAALQREGLRGGAAAVVKVAKPALREQKSITMPVLSCFFYFLSIALTAPAMPSMANKMINKDGTPTHCPSPSPRNRRTPRSPNFRNTRPPVATNAGDPPQITEEARQPVPGIPALSTPTPPSQESTRRGVD